MGGETPSAVGSGCCRSKQDKKTTLSQYDHPSTAQNPRISSQCGDTVEGNQLSRNPRIPRGAAWPARSSPPRLGRQAVCLSAMIRDLTGLPSKPRRPRRPGPRRRSLVRSRIRNVGQSDTDASRRTRLAGSDLEFAVLVCHPSFGPPPSRRNSIGSCRFSGGRRRTRGSASTGWAWFWPGGAGVSARLPLSPTNYPA